VDNLKSPIPAIRLLAGQSVTLLFAAGAIIWLWKSLVAITNFALRYPAWDQYRSYVIYLTRSFPDNAIQAENGHRTILPNLLRLADIRWFAASQTFQIVIGGAAAVIALVLIISTIIREKSVSVIARAASCLLTVIALFWLGNARMLFHGNEMAHVYFVTLFCVIALLAANKARNDHPSRWMSIASIFCLLATFSFGTGIASFATVLLLGVVLRIRWRHLLIPASLLLVTLWAYLIGLPGQSGVSGVLALDPSTSGAIFLQWLSAPWMTTWLGGSTSIGSSTPTQDVSQWIIATTNWLLSSLGTDWAMRNSLMIGIIGITAYLAMLAHAFFRHATLSKTRVLALGLSTFILGVAATICLARLNGFILSPGQIFADRYLPWSCLFWLGLGLYAASPAISTTHRWHTPAVFAGTCLVWLSFSPTNTTGWMALVHKSNQQSAVAAQLGIWDPDRFPDDDSASRENVLTTLALFKQRRLSMFSEPAFGIVENEWHTPEILPTELTGSSAHVIRQFEETLGKRQVADFEGWLPHIHGLSPNTILAVVDNQGNFRGLAKFSFASPYDKRGKYKPIRMRGFSGYVLDTRSGEHLKVLAWDAASAQVLAVVSLEIPEVTPSARPGE